MANRTRGWEKPFNVGDLEGTERLFRTQGGRFVKAVVQPFEVKHIGLPQVLVGLTEEGREVRAHVRKTKPVDEA